MDDLQRGWTLFTQGMYDEAEAAFLTLIGHPATTAETRTTATFNLGYCLAHTGRFDQSRTVYAQLRQAATVSGNRSLEHMALHQLGMVERMAGNWPAALACFEEERRLIAALGDGDLAVAVNAYELGLVALNLGRLPESRQYLETSLVTARRTTDLIAVACAHRSLGDWYAAAGALQEAESRWRDALRIFAEAGDLQGVQGRLAGSGRCTAG